MTPAEQAALKEWENSAEALMQTVIDFECAVLDEDVLLAEKLLGTIQNQVEQCLILATWR